MNDELDFRPHVQALKSLQRIITLRRVELSATQSALFAATLLLPLEWLSLGQPDCRLYWTSATLYAFCAIGIACVYELQEWWIQKIRANAIQRATARSVGTLLVTLPACRHLFEGSFAASLPGASIGHILVPLGIATGFAALLWFGECQLRTRKSQKWRLGFSIGLAWTSAALELLNRGFEPAEYLDLHALLVVISMSALFLSIRLSHRSMQWPDMPWLSEISPRKRKALLWTFAAINVSLVLAFGLRDSDDRLQLANHSVNTRVLVRAGQGNLDWDGDGYSAALGGPDCDDFDAKRNPAQAEQTGNDVDEDCDGIAAQVIATESPAQEARDRLRLKWLAAPKTRDFLAQQSNRPLILIMVDALRASPLQNTPENRKDFPALFEILDSSQNFSYAFSPAAGTDLSMATLLTGRVDAFDRPETTIFESLQASGRKTYGIIPREVLRYAGHPLLLRGLDDHHTIVNDPHARDKGGVATSRQISAIGLRQIDTWSKKDDPTHFALWLHYFDAHEHDELPHGERSFQQLLPQGRRASQIERYRAALKLVDGGIAELITGLKSRGLWDEAIIVLASDHGESMGEDSRLPKNHGRFVYNPLIHIPLAIRVPGVAGKVHTTAVGLIDINPTLRELMDLPAPKGDIHGQSLLAYLGPDAPASLQTGIHTLAINESDQRGVIQWPYKFLRRSDANLIELYNIEKDFAERTNLAQDPGHADVMRNMASLLSTFPNFLIDRTRAGRTTRERRAARFGRENSEFQKSGSQ